MGILELVFGKKKAAAKPRHSRPAPSTQFATSQSVQGTNPHTIRKDLLKVVLREMLLRNGIPNAWLSADLLRTTNAKREQGIHVRFLLRHFEPRLLQHGVAIEQEFSQRLLVLDPQARNWLMGFSWQFVLPDTSACPALPNAGYWTAPAAELAAREDTAPAALQQPAADVIAGPVVIPQPVDDVRADLERLLALRDDDMKRHGAGDNFAATRPATL